MIHRSLVAFGLCVAALPWLAASGAQAPRAGTYRAKVEQVERAWKLYNAGKFKEAAQVLREPTEGVGACGLWTMRQFYLGDHALKLRFTSYRARGAGDATTDHMRRPLRLGLYASG